MTGSDVSLSFRLVYVPGVMPGKWVRVWNERLPGVPLALAQAPAARAAGLLLAGDADAGLVRLPVDRTVLSAIPLYTEQTVVVVPRDHIVTAVDEVSPEDLADEILLHPLDDVLTWENPPGRPALERPATTADAVELVAAGIGVLVVPLSLARLHHRKDLTHRPLKDAPESSVALVWPEDATSGLVEEFIGIVRGRTVNSTRGRTRPQPSAAQGKSKEKPGRAEKGGAGAGAGTRRRQAPGGPAARGQRKGTGGTPKNPRRGKPRRGS
ncbi:LysR family transcriptional regulator substrate-binding protein [Streptomyces sp. KMM 9044]|uniref:LysR family transcriptional regulator substrate-binding protein n=1 Tax=Streptomyces sp. KMM 9044 TaxID=2744474 RepID=UPI002151BAC8|nr:LysR family transcriptional regulator substrate-binding protein [Streptomyces sp. KMM 9044]WAX81386.1 LysR family transcriptional regulator substrate-binding protein [Streptomyces sp. KMM 9044]